MQRRKKPPVLERLVDAFTEIPDPRVARTRAHPLVNVLTMALFGAIAGADGWDGLALFAAERAEFFASFLDVSKGTPSADTFRRVFEALDPTAFQAAFRKWLQPFLESLEGQTIAMDGKALRGALARAEGQGRAFHLMHVWAVDQQLLLAQKAVEGAPGEMQAASELLRLLDLKGATVTADANSCTAPMTQDVREAGAHYVFSLKGNRGALHDHVEKLFAAAEEDGFSGVSHFESHGKAHGRVESRLVRAMPLGTLPDRIKADWKDLRTVVMVERLRVDQGTERASVERAYYITSHPPKPRMLAGHIRGHWSIENQLHHCLDVTFDEDRRAIHDENGAQNFALITRFALALLKREPTKLSVAMKRRKAAWSATYVLDVLARGFPQV